MDIQNNEPVVPPVSASIAKQKQASWGAIVIIVLILAMIVVGAFYAWGKRVAQTQQPATVSGASY
ncbi:MAG TPA: hypothetical protein VGN56_00460 [Candidatus Paceibacterota bacterium]|jgi:hypothetical protein|nr:hypothetical protein [Candidatus Paceibacterota bacterium]